MLDNPVVAYCVLLRWWGEKNVCSTPIIPQVPLDILRLILVREVDQSTWQCSGSEYILTDCELENTGIRSSHALDVGVKCQPGRDTLSICASFFAPSTVICIYTYNNVS